MQPARLLDVLIPTYKRPKCVFEVLSSGLKQNMPGVYFVIIDDGSTASESIEGLGDVTTAQVCEHFKDDRVIYIRNSENIGLARSWEKYYAHHCQAKYTTSVVDKDLFIDGEPFNRALQQLENDDSLCMVVVPLTQKDRVHENVAIDFDYNTMSGEEFLSRFVRDPQLQHCTNYAPKRVSMMRQAGVPRDLGLRKSGLDDCFGIDIDVILMLAAQGRVGFEHRPPIKRSTLAGATERYPLTFAYTYYQYAKRAVNELRAQGKLSRESANAYIYNWLLLILRGLTVSYRHVHGTEAEVGTSRIGQHLRLPIYLYLALEFLKYRIMPTKEIMEQVHFSRKFKKEKL
jgi:glycosyltransferase involved in cell wall biosynthesis